MTNSKRNYLIRGILRVLPVALGCALLPGFAHGQPETLANAIDEVNRGNYAYVQQITKLAGNEKAIPILEHLFANSEDVDTKAWIASELVKLGDKDNIYCDLLVKQAREVIESDIPSPITFDADGKAVPGQLSPEFTAWAKAHNLSPEKQAIAAQDAVLPIKIGLLAKTGDARAIPLLRRGLLSPNYFIENAAAMGLVMLKDRDSIPLIVEACKRAPSEAASAIAMSLLQFHDPEAQRAAEPYLSKDLVKALHEEKN